METYNTDLKEESIALRVQGVPISKIVRILDGPSKTTVQRWTRHVKPDHICHPLYLTDTIDHRYFSAESLAEFPERHVLLGYIAADGCIHQPKHGSRTLAFNISRKDQETLDVINEQICLGKRKISKAKKTKSVQLHIPSNSICDDLSVFGIVPRKTFSLRFPNLGSEAMRYYIRGYFYGDGCFHRYSNRDVFHIVANNEFADSLKAYLIDINAVDYCGSYRLKRSPRNSQVVFQGKHAKRFAQYIFNDDKMILLQRKHVTYAKD